jgi:nucleoside 2-deoxyribosyltransferase
MASATPQAASAQHATHHRTPRRLEPNRTIVTGSRTVGRARSIAGRIGTFHFPARQTARYPVAPRRVPDPEEAAMHPERRFRIYLAGPVSGCTQDEIRDWRDAVKANWQTVFDFDDPADDHLPRDPGVEDYDDYEIVVRDQQSIARCDGVVANMWKESIGTALGVFQACVQGKPVAVADPNGLGNRILRHYVRGEVRATVDEAMGVLRRLLAERHAIADVSKRNGRVEPFARDKLALSIRHACLAAGRNDMLVAVEIVPAALRLLAERHRDGTASSKDIQEAVWTVLQRTEADPLRAAEYAGIRAAWERHVGARPPANRRAIALDTTFKQAPIHATPRDIEVCSDKAHATIWGKGVWSIADLPPGPRRVFEHLARVDGIRRVSLHRFGPGPRTNGCALELLASKTAGCIEGKCHDEGSKGRVQQFRILLNTSDPNETDAIRQTLLRFLADHHMIWRSKRQDRLAADADADDGQAT